MLKVKDTVPSLSSSTLTEFAAHVAVGLSSSDGKYLSSRYLYDDLGSTLFEAITLLPEYGLTRADERLLRTHSPHIAQICGPLEAVAELGSGSGKKTIHLLHAALSASPNLTYYPIDVSAAALSACEREVADLCHVEGVCGDWTRGLSQISQQRRGDRPLLLLFLGSSVGNLQRQQLPEFFRGIHQELSPGDYFLLGADLVKDPERMIEAYDDPTGVTAAFNLNLLGRINRELDGNFDLRSFRHEARWNGSERRIEMHLTSLQDQTVRIGAVDCTYSFSAGETIWTESSHKFDVSELQSLAESNGFRSLQAWVDPEWPLAELLWQAD